MEIDYDKDFKKVMAELQTNFGWSNIEMLPDSYKDFLNDTIKAVKNCSIPDVVGQSEQLKCQCTKTEKYYDPIGDIERCQECEKAL